VHGRHAIRERCGHCRRLPTALATARARALGSTSSSAPSSAASMEHGGRRGAATPRAHALQRGAGPGKSHRSQRQCPSAAPVALCVWPGIRTGESLQRTRYHQGCAHALAGVPCGVGA
jgi:hypothetical protein